MALHRPGLQTDPERVLRAREYKPLTAEEASNQSIDHITDWLRRSHQRLRAGDSIAVKARILGLHEHDGQLRPGDYLGAVWVGPDDHRVPLVVSPKFKNMHYLSMYMACLADPTVAEHLENCFFTWPEDPPIEAATITDLTPLMVAVFLASLRKLCQRHLRRNFITMEENLDGHLKGRVLLPTHLRHNIARMRPDRVYCQFQVISNDCLENRILRAALEQSSLYIASHRVPKVGPIPDWLTQLQSWVRLCRSALSGVSVTRILPRDFVGLRHSGTFIHYRRPHHYARMVLSLLGFDPERCYSDRELKINMVPPFALCSFELFERYTEALLRRSGHDYIWAGYGKEHNLKPKRGRIPVRPDFVLRNRGWIVDCKYKRPKGEAPLNEDVYQIVAYSRHRCVLRMLRELAEGRPTNLILLYPEIANEARPTFDLCERLARTEPDRSFDIPLYVIQVPCPVRQTAYMPLT